jgi:hypothetical protein
VGCDSLTTIIGQDANVGDISEPIGIRRLGDGIAVLDPARDETDKAAIDLRYQQRTAFSNLIFDPGQISVRNLLILLKFARPAIGFSETYADSPLEQAGFEL